MNNASAQVSYHSKMVLSVVLCRLLLLWGLPALNTTLTPDSDCSGSFVPNKSFFLYHIGRFSYGGHHESWGQ